MHMTLELDVVQDMAELEACVGQNLWPLEQCGPPFRAIRALRPLLFVDTAALPTSPLLRELPAAAAAHLLYQRAPAGLQSPLTRAGLTPAQVRMVSTFALDGYRCPHCALSECWHTWSCWQR